MGNHAKPPEPSDPGPLARLLLPLAIGFAVLAFFSLQSSNGPSSPRSVSYSEIKELIRDGDVREATLEATAIVAVLRSPESDGTERVRAITPQQPDPALLPLLEEMGVIVTAEEPRGPSVLLSLLPWILLIVLLRLAQPPHDGRRDQRRTAGRDRRFSGWPGIQAHQVHPQGHVRRRRGSGRSQARSVGTGRVPARSGPLSKSRCHRAAWRPVDGATGHRQDAAGAGLGRRGGCAVLFDLGLGIHRGFRGRWRGPRAQDVRRGTQAGALDHLYRRAGQHRAHPGHRAGRRP